VAPDVSGVVNSQGGNLVGIFDGSLGWRPEEGYYPYDIWGWSGGPLDPRLNPPDYYGGPTICMTLQVTPPNASPALGAGDLGLSVGPTDQRGFSRWRGDGAGVVDIGAVEMQPNELPPGDSGGPAISLTLQANSRARGAGSPDAVEGTAASHGFPRTESSVVELRAVQFQAGDLPPDYYGRTTISLALQASGRARGAAEHNDLAGTIDQHGLPRQADGLVDIGAVQM
jgi:hypothetical protein